MSLSTRCQTSWQLLKSSLKVIRRNPKLLLFPVLSTLCSFGLVLFFFLPFFLIVFANAGFDWADFAADWKVGWPNVGDTFQGLGYLYGAVLYLACIFAATFFNVAFYNEIIRALTGEPVSLGGGLAFAMRRIRSILMWSLLAGTVGLIIRSLEERFGWIGRIALAFVGTVWSVAAVFAIPVIIREENINPLAVLRDSAATVKKTWGESLIGFVGVQLAGAAFVLVSLIFAGWMVLMTLVTHLSWLPFAGLAVWLPAVLAYSLLIGMATHVYRCALYVYASEGVVPAPYTPELMDAGWRVRKR